MRAFVKMLLCIIAFFFCFLIIDVYSSCESLFLENKAEAFIGGHEFLGESLQDGFYLYLVSNGHAYIANRFEKAPELITHRSIKRGFPIKDVAGAGEFRVLNGRVVYFNNRSGTFKFSSLELELSKMLLIEKGLNIESTTRIADYSVNKPVDGHVEQFEHARIVSEVNNDPRLMAIRNKIKLLIEILYEKYPSKDVAGEIDLNEIIWKISKCGLMICEEAIASTVGVYQIVLESGYRYAAYSIAQDNSMRIDVLINFVSKCRQCFHRHQSSHP